MSPDFKDLLSTFNAHSVEFLVVGAHALAAHGRIRATGDLGVWVRPERESAQRVLTALAKFGAPLRDLSDADLQRPGTVFQIGVAPLRIDVLTSIDGVAFEEAWTQRFQTRFAGMPVSVLSLEHLIRNKRAVVLRISPIWSGLSATTRANDHQGIRRQAAGGLEPRQSYLPAYPRRPPAGRGCAS